jgi:hypothetical protein
LQKRITLLAKSGKDFIKLFIVYSRIVDENVKQKADIRLTLKTKPVAGVTIPIFGVRNMDEEKCNDNKYLLYSR